jgi:hypothetical protein
LRTIQSIGGCGSWNRGVIFKMNWDIDLDKKTATSINGITFKLVESAPDVFHWECVNPKDIPPDDLDDVILDKMVKEADGRYKWELSKLKG